MYWGSDPWPADRYIPYRLSLYLTDTAVFEYWDTEQQRSVCYNNTFTKHQYIFSRYLCYSSNYNCTTCTIFLFSPSPLSHSHSFTLPAVMPLTLITVKALCNILSKSSMKGRCWMSFFFFPSRVCASWLSRCRLAWMITVFFSAPQSNLVPVLTRERVCSIFT